MRLSIRSCRVILIRIKFHNSILVLIRITNFVEIGAPEMGLLKQTGGCNSCSLVVVKRVTDELQIFSES